MYAGWGRGATAAEQQQPLAAGLQARFPRDTPMAAKEPEGGEGWLTLGWAGGDGGGAGGVWRRGGRGGRVGSVVAICQSWLPRRAGRRFASATDVVAVVAAPTATTAVGGGGRTVLRTPPPSGPGRRSSALASRSGVGSGDYNHLQRTASARAAWYSCLSHSPRDVTPADSTDGWGSSASRSSFP